MNQSVDMNPAQFERYERAAESRFIKDQLRKNQNPRSIDPPKQLTVDFAHVTDSVNFLLACLDCPATLRGFIDALIGVAGYRAGGNEWFEAADWRIALRASRSKKWVQNQRKELVSWQALHNVALIDIEDNQYNQGEKRPHKYRVSIARLGAETIVDAKDSINWQKHRFDEAIQEAAKTTRDLLPEFPTHIKHKRSREHDAETIMERNLSFALTKVRKAKQQNELTGNRIELNPKMLETIENIQSELDSLKHAVRQSNVKKKSSPIVEEFSTIMEDPF